MSILSTCTSKMGRFMRTIRRYLSLLLPLIALLVGIESIILVTRALNYYEDLVGKNYAIVLVSQKELDLKDIKAQIPETTALLELESTSILQRYYQKFSKLCCGKSKKFPAIFLLTKTKFFPQSKQD